MSVTVRLAREGDVPFLEELFLQLSRWELQRDEAIRRAIGDPQGELLVAEFSGQVVAFIHQVFYHDPLHAGLNSTITSLFVRDVYRGKGIGSQLVQEALVNAEARKVVEVHVDTEEGNSEAIKLYQKLGFKKVGVIFEKHL